MDQEGWVAVDEFLIDLLQPSDPVLDAAVKHTEAAGMPLIQVSPNEGKLLHLLVRVRGARRVLEIGTLGGYSTIWMARALPADGRLISLEFNPKHAEVARANIARAGLDSVVEVIVGPAVESMTRLRDEGAEPFDFIFIDADKPSYPDYLELSLALSAPGTIIVADNIVQGGQVLNPDSEDASARGLRRFLEQMSREPRLDAVGLQTVGVKGYNGLSFAIVKG